MFGTWLFVDWVALACKWNFNATAVDALVERSHIARWTLDPSTRPSFFSKIAHVLPAEAPKADPPKGGRESAGQIPPPPLVCFVCFVSRGSARLLGLSDASWFHTELRDGRVFADAVRRGVPHSASVVRAPDAIAC